MPEEFDKAKTILNLSLNKTRAEEYHNYCNIIDLEKLCKPDIFKFLWLKNVFKKLSFRNRFVCTKGLTGKRNSKVSTGS